MHDTLGVEVGQRLRGGRMRERYQRSATGEHGQEQEEQQQCTTGAATPQQHLARAAHARSAAAHSGGACLQVRHCIHAHAAEAVVPWPCLGSTGGPRPPVSDARALQQGGCMGWAPSKQNTTQVGMAKGSVSTGFLWLDRCKARKRKGKGRWYTGQHTSSAAAGGASARHGRQAGKRVPDACLTEALPRHHRPTLQVVHHQQHLVGGAVVHHLHSVGVWLHGLC